jgi:hypothetical protein
MKKQTGIWIDSEKAIVVHLLGQKHRIETLVPQVDYRVRITGKPRTAVKLGFFYQSYREKESEKIRLGQKHFFESILEQLNPESDIAIFGPGQEKSELKIFLKTTELYRHKAICLLPAIANTQDHQFVQMVETFYGNPRG